MESLDYPEHLGIMLFKTNFILTAKIHTNNWVNNNAAWQ